MLCYNYKTHKGVININTLFYKDIKNISKVNQITENYVIDILNNYLQLSYIIDKNGSSILFSYLKNKDCINNPFYKGLKDFYSTTINKTDNIIENELSIYVLFNYKNMLVELKDITTYINTIISIIIKYINISDKLIKEIQNEIYKHYIFFIMQKGLSVMPFNIKNIEKFDKSFLLKQFCFQPNGILFNTLQEFISNKPLTINNLETDLFVNFINNCNKISIIDFIKDIPNIINKYINIEFNEQELWFLKRELGKYFIFNKLLLLQNYLTEYKNNKFAILIKLETIIPKLEKYKNITYNIYDGEYKFYFNQVLFYIKLLQDKIIKKRSSYIDVLIVCNKNIVSILNLFK